MALNDDQILTLVRALGITREHEINCNECLDMVGEFAERELAGRQIPEALDVVRHHLALCGECREEYGFLLTALQRMQELRKMKDEA
jgi:uncharacterized protein with PIN domain